MVQEFVNAAIILEKDPSVRLNFQVFPDPIIDTKSVNWANIAVIGRSEPVKTYVGNPARTFAYNLVFATSVDAGDDGTADEVKRKVNFCQSLAYPQTTQSGIVAFPPVCILIIGNMILSRVVVKSVISRYKGPWNLSTRRSAFQEVSRPTSGIGPPSPPRDFEVDTAGDGDELFVDIPLVAEVALVMEETNVTPHSHSFVMNGRRAL